MPTGVALQILATEEPKGWQPISTAPRDGTSILTYVKVSDTSIVRLASWSEVPKELIEAGDPDDTGWASYCSSVSWELLDGVFAPTHWMPCPEFPK